MRYVFCMVVEKHDLDVCYLYLNYCGNVEDTGNICKFQVEIPEGHKFIAAYVVFISQSRLHLLFIIPFQSLLYPDLGFGGSGAYPMNTGCEAGIIPRWDNTGYKKNPKCF